MPMMHDAFLTLTYVFRIPWLNDQTKERNIKPDPVNRPLMESMVEAYADRILASGLNVDCSGPVQFRAPGSMITC